MRNTLSDMWGARPRSVALPPLCLLARLAVAAASLGSGSGHSKDERAAAALGGGSAAALGGGGSSPPAGCWTAQVAQWPWCSGYAAAGYACAGAFCSSAECVGTCGQCADFYAGAALDAASARCCAALAPGGGCEGAPLPGDAPYNPPYGFPNNGPGALIVEGPVAYPGGAPVWANSSGEAGAYAFAMLAQSGKADAECAAPPAAGGAWRPPPGLRPVSLWAHGEKIAACALGCNVSEVARTGRDPCNAGSILGDSAAPSLRGVYANYSCYFGGASWLHPPGLGVCGFNCSALQADGSLCSEEDIEGGRCDVYCDSRTLPARGGARGAAP